MKTLLFLALAVACFMGASMLYYGAQSIQHAKDTVKCSAAAVTKEANQ
jgi:hypothetical protein